MLDPVAGRAAELCCGARRRARCHRARHRRAQRSHDHGRPGLSAAPAIIGTPRTRMRELKRERAALLRRMVEAKAIVAGEPATQGARCSCASAAARPSRRAASSAPPSSSPRRFAILSVGTQRRSRGRNAGARRRRADRPRDRRRPLASRVLLVTDRANIVPARILRGGQPVISTGRGDGTIDVRPLEVGRNPFKPGDIIVTSGTGGLYPPLVPDRPGRPARRRRRDRPARSPTRRDQLRHGRTAVRAAARRRGRRAPTARRTDGPRGARPAHAAIGKGPRAGARLCAGDRVVPGVAADRSCRSYRRRGWWPDFGLLMLIAWRLLRADAWPAWWAAPLGFVNDLVTGTSDRLVRRAVDGGHACARPRSTGARCGATIGSNGPSPRCFIALAEIAAMARRRM